MNSGEPGDLRWDNFVRTVQSGTVRIYLALSSDASWAEGICRQSARLSRAVKCGTLTRTRWFCLPRSPPHRARSRPPTSPPCPGGTRSALSERSTTPQTDPDSPPARIALVVVSPRPADDSRHDGADQRDDQGRSVRRRPQQCGENTADADGVGGAAQDCRRPGDAGRGAGCVGGFLVHGRTRAFL